MENDRNDINTSIAISQKKKKKKKGDSECKAIHVGVIIVGNWKEEEDSYKNEKNREIRK